MFLGRRKKKVNEEFLNSEQIAQGYWMAEYDHCLCLYKGNTRVCIFGLRANRSLVQKIIELEEKNCW